MNTLWILVADEGRARILQWQADSRLLEPIEELGEAAASPGREAEAGHEAPGQETERFARRVANRLDEGRRAGRYARLRIVAAPRFIGSLHAALSREVSATVERELDTNLVNLLPRELADHLFPTDDGGALH